MSDYLLFYIEGCSHCDAMTAKLNQHQIPFTSLELTQERGTTYNVKFAPTLVQGSRRVVGYDKFRVEEFLNVSK